MKILFQEPLSQEATFGKFGSQANNTFPQGIASIITHLENQGIKDVTYLEPNLWKMTQKEYEIYIEHHRFDVIGISSTTMQMGDAIHTFKTIKRVSPETKTVIGGIHATTSPQETIQIKEIDYAVIGPGETPLTELIQGTPTKQIRGLATKKQINPPSQEQLKKIPSPAYHKFPMKKYVTQITYAKQQPTYSVSASRGCIYNCAFCQANQTTQKRVRYKDPQQVINEIKQLINEYGAKGIYFTDSNLTTNPAWITAFTQELQKQNLKISWSCNSRTDTITEELMKEMKQAGCWEILYGIESANQKSLDTLNKGTTTKTNTDTIQTSIKTGIYTYTTYILGIPGETSTDVENTIRYACQQGNHQAMFYLPIPYPKTKLWQLCQADGGLKKNPEWKDWQAWNYQNPIYTNPLIGKEQMQKLIKKAYTKFYTNPKTITTNLKQILTLQQKPTRYLTGITNLKNYLK